MKNKFMNLFTGRIHRLTFFFGIIVFGIVSAIIYAIASPLLSTGVVGVIIYSIIALIISILFSGLFARRMRDINWTPHLAWLFGILWIAKDLDNISDNISIGFTIPSTVLIVVDIVLLFLCLIGFFKKGKADNKNGPPQATGFWDSLINI